MTVVVHQAEVDDGEQVVRDDGQQTGYDTV